MCRSLEESVEMMRCCSEVDSADEQSCYEEILEDQQVWEELEDGARHPSKWEESEPGGRGQLTYTTRKQPSESDWEQSQDSGWEEPDSVDPDLKLEERMDVTSLEKAQTDSVIPDQVVCGVMTTSCPPAASIETTDSSSPEELCSPESACTKFCKRLQRSWRNFKSFFTSFI